MGMVIINELGDDGTPTCRTEVTGTFPLHAEFEILGADEPDRRDLRDAIERALTPLGAQGSSYTHGQAIDADWFGGATTPVLVFLADAGPPLPQLEATCNAMFARRNDLRGIGVVAPRTRPTDVLPTELHPRHATISGDGSAWAATSWTSAIDDILRVGGIDPDARAVFISYSRSDIHYAHQLHDTLLAARFDVFLDSYDIDPGERFADVVDDAVVNCGMLVVIETANSVASQWVRHEVAQATSGPAGYAAIRPVPRHPGFETIPDAFRLRSPDPQRWQSFVVAQHRAQLLTRRHELTASVMTALLARGLHPSFIGAGCSCDAGPIGVEVRPPTSRQYRRLDSYHRTRCAAMFAPRPVLAARRADDTWLATVSQIRRYDIGLLTRAVDDL